MGAPGRRRSRPDPDLDPFAPGAAAPAAPDRMVGGGRLRHVAVAAALVLVPLYTPDPLFEREADAIRVLIYDPPPPPPPPLPRGSPMGKRATAVAPVEPRPVATPRVEEPHALIAPVEKPCRWTMRWG